MSIRRRTVVASAILIVALTACDEAEPVQTARLEVLEVSVELNCTRADEDDACAVDAFIEIRNPGSSAAMVRGCRVGRSPHDGTMLALRDPVTIHPGRTGIAKVDFLYGFAFDLSKADLQRTRSWYAECQTSEPPVAHSARRPFETSMECAKEFYFWGPAKLEKKFILSTFSPDAAARWYGDLMLFSDEDIRICETGFEQAYDAYRRAAADAWPPYGSEKLWLVHRQHANVCATAIWEDFPGPPRLVLRGAISIQEAAADIAADSPGSLRSPVYHGCKLGLRRGLRLREQYLG